MCTDDTENKTPLPTMDTDHAMLPTQKQYAPYRDGAHMVVDYAATDTYHHNSHVQ